MNCVGGGGEGVVDRGGVVNSPSLVSSAVEGPLWLGLIEKAGTFLQVMPEAGRSAGESSGLLSRARVRSDSFASLGLEVLTMAVVLLEVGACSWEWDRTVGPLTRQPGGSSHSAAASSSSVGAMFGVCDMTGMMVSSLFLEERTGGGGGEGGKKIKASLKNQKADVKGKKRYRS